jgi:hypothetical protein
MPGALSNPHGRPIDASATLRRIERDTEKLARAHERWHGQTLAALLQGHDAPAPPEGHDPLAGELACNLRHLTRIVDQLRVGFERAQALPTASGGAGRKRRRRDDKAEREQVLLELGHYLADECGWHVGDPN